MRPATQLPPQVPIQTYISASAFKQLLGHAALRLNQTGQLRTINTLRDISRGASILLQSTVYIVQSYLGGVGRWPLFARAGGVHWTYTRARSSRQVRARAVLARTTRANFPEIKFKIKTKQLGF